MVEYFVEMASIVVAFAIFLIVMYLLNNLPRLLEAVLP